MKEQFMKKLLYIEKNGAQAGVPLGRELASWRKLVVGNRDYRIIFRLNEDETVATICAIGSREDGECYEDAKIRAEQKNDAEAVSLAESMLKLHQNRRNRKAGRKKTGSGSRS